MTQSILTIEHSPAKQQKLREWLTPTGINLTMVDSCHTALHVLNYQHPQIILFSSRLPGISARKLATKLKLIAPQARLIVIIPATDQRWNNPQMITAVHDLLFEPLHREELLFNIAQSLKVYRLLQENDYLKEELSFATLLLNHNNRGIPLCNSHRS